MVDITIVNGDFVMVYKPYYCILLLDNSEGSSAAKRGAHRLWKDFGISLPCPLALALWIAWIFGESPRINM